MAVAAYVHACRYRWVGPQGRDQQAAVSVMAACCLLSGSGWTSPPSARSTSART